MVSSMTTVDPGRVFEESFEVFFIPILCYYTITIEQIQKKHGKSYQFLLLHPLFGSLHFGLQVAGPGFSLGTEARSLEQAVSCAADIRACPTPCLGLEGSLVDDGVYEWYFL